MQPAKWPWTKQPEPGDGFAVSYDNDAGQEVDTGRLRARVHIVERLYRQLQERHVKQMAAWEDKHERLEEECERLRRELAAAQQRPVPVPTPASAWNGIVDRIAADAVAVVAAERDQLRDERDVLASKLARQWVMTLALKTFVLGLERAQLVEVVALVDETLDAADPTKPQTTEADSGDESEAEDFSMTQEDSMPPEEYTPTPAQMAEQAEEDADDEAMRLVAGGLAAAILKAEL